MCCKLGLTESKRDIELYRKTTWPGTWHLPRGCPRKLPVVLRSSFEVAPAAAVLAVESPRSAPRDVGLAPRAALVQGGTCSVGKVVALEVHPGKNLGAPPVCCSWNKCTEKEQSVSIAHCPHLIARTFLLYIEFTNV